MYKKTELASHHRSAPHRRGDRQHLMTTSLSVLYKMHPPGPRPRPRTHGARGHAVVLGHGVLLAYLTLALALGLAVLPRVLN